MSIECILSGQTKGEVESFNGRTGKITPQSGDYTAAQVGALPSNGTAVKSNEATKLSTGRTIRTNLANTNATNFNGTTNITPGVTGILDVAHGGLKDLMELGEGWRDSLGVDATGSNADYTVKLTTPRTISLTGDIYGSTTFDGTADKSISTSLSTVNYNRGSCGPFTNGICWVANNRGIPSSIATWKLTAKKAGTFRCLHTGSSDRWDIGYEFLITYDDIDSNTSNISQNNSYGGYYEKDLKVGDALTFTCKEHTNLVNGDYLAIGHMTLGNINTQFDSITPQNIDTYFTVTNGEYTFEPMIIFMGNSMTVDAKGRVTESTGIFPAVYSFNSWKKVTASKSKPYDWGDETAVGDAAWWAGLKNWVISTTSAQRQACVGKKKKVSLSTAILGANAASMVCIGADQDGDKTLTFQTEGTLPYNTLFDDGTIEPQSIMPLAGNISIGNPLWESSTARKICNNFGNQCSASASLKTITKLTSSATENRDNPADVETTDKCWLPSEQEMGLNEYSSSRLECTKGTTNTGYSYYNNDDKRMKYGMNADGSLNKSSSTDSYWERSCSYNGAVCNVYSDGTADYNTHNSNSRLAPAFTIG